MSSTNKTTHYELSQFLGTDKPAWLNDYNTDMSKIDAGINSAQSTATSADGKATTNTTAIGTLSSLTTTDKTSLVNAVNEVKTDAGTAQGTANDAMGASTANTTDITNIKKELNWNTFNSVTFTGTYNPTSQDVKIAMNESKNQFKLYGRVAYTNNITGSGTYTITTGDTGLRPTEAITIYGTSIKRRDISNSIAELDPYSYTINTDGTITVEIRREANCTYLAINFIACITILKQFGD